MIYIIQCKDDNHTCYVRRVNIINSDYKLLGAKVRTELTEHLSEALLINDKYLAEAITQYMKDWSPFETECIEFVEQAFHSLEEGGRR